MPHVFLPFYASKLRHSFSLFKIKYHSTLSLFWLFITLFFFSSALFSFIFHNSFSSVFVAVSCSSLSTVHFYIFLSVFLSFFFFFLSPSVELVYFIFLSFFLSFLCSFPSFSLFFFFFLSPSVELVYFIFLSFFLFSVVFHLSLFFLLLSFSFSRTCIFYFSVFLSFLCSFPSFFSL